MAENVTFKLYLYGIEIRTLRAGGGGCTSSNCTFMELKCILTVRFASSKSSNCTFMELKCNDKTFCDLYFLVQIVPLWNWNALAQHGKAQNYDVQIVPLWNWNTKQRSSMYSNISSNCTFMELKFDRRQRNERSHRVLIVPLWNWNIDNMYWVNSEQSSNLIVPLWN